MLSRILLTFLLLLCLSSAASARRPPGPRTWNWTSSGSAKARSFKGTLLLANETHVILGYETKSQLRYQKLPVKELADLDILYVQDWRRRRREGIDKYWQATNTPALQDRATILEQAANLGNPRAQNSLGIARALAGLYEETRGEEGAEELFDAARDFYRAHVDYQPSFARPMVAVLNNLAIAKFRDSSVSAGFRTLGQIETLFDGRFPAAVDHNLKVYQLLLRGKPSGTFRRLSDKVTQTQLVQVQHNPRRGWWYLADDFNANQRAAPNMFLDRICMSCNGMGTLACPNSKCAKGNIRYKEWHSRMVQVGDRVKELSYSVDKYRDCPACVGGRTKCMFCNPQNRQNGKTRDRRF